MAVVPELSALPLLQHQVMRGQVSEETEGTMLLLSVCQSFVSAGFVSPDLLDLRLKRELRSPSSLMTALLLFLLIPVKRGERILSSVMQNSPCSSTQEILKMKLFWKVQVFWLQGVIHMFMPMQNIVHCFSVAYICGFFTFKQQAMLLGNSAQAEWVLRMRKHDLSNDLFRKYQTE